MTSRKENKYCRKAITGLKRLPEKFSWLLLRLLHADLDRSSLMQYDGGLSSIIRKEDASAYHSYCADNSLQSIGSLGNLQPFEVGVFRLWSAIGKRNRQIESVDPRKRAAEAIRKSLELDHFYDRGFLTSTVGREARREIACLLPVVALDDIYGGARHGPGKTVNPLIARDSYSKYASWPYACSPLSQDLAVGAIRADYRWWGALEDSYRRLSDLPYWTVLPAGWVKEECLKPTPYNRIVTVPKDGTKDRTIAIEPIINVYLQLGVDGVFRRALRHWGIDLDDQEPNQKGAYSGSVNWRDYDGLATLDLSSASDSISRTLVEGLLPKAWFELLDQLRSPYGLLPDGTAWRYARMSSMGNGYTFALETLIFAAILRAIVKVYGMRRDLNNLLVYGDDCEFPSYLYSHVQNYFWAAGFTVNTSKSFSRGHPVRESCGKEYYRGYDITPPKFPEEWDCAETLLAFRNRLFQWSLRVLGCVDPVKATIQTLDSYLDPLPDFGPPGVSGESRYRFEDRPAPYAVKLKVLERHRRPKSPPDFLFGKLMHNLASTDSDRGTRFDTDRQNRGTLQLVERLVYFPKG